MSSVESRVSDTLNKESFGNNLLNGVSRTTTPINKPSNVLRYCVREYAVTRHKFTVLEDDQTNVFLIERKCLNCGQVWGWTCGGSTDEPCQLLGHEKPTVHPNEIRRKIYFDKTGIEVPTPLMYSTFGDVSQF